MLKSLLPNDPTGEMLHILDQFARTPAPATRRRRLGFSRTARAP